MWSRCDCGSWFLPYHHGLLAHTEQPQHKNTLKRAICLWKQESTKIQAKMSTTESNKKKEEVKQKSTNANTGVQSLNKVYYCAQFEKEVASVGERKKKRKSYRDDLVSPHRAGSNGILTLDTMYSAHHINIIIRTFLASVYNGDYSCIHVYMHARVYWCWIQISRTIKESGPATSAPQSAPAQYVAFLGCRHRHCGTANRNYSNIQCVCMYVCVRTNDDEWISNKWKSLRSWLSEIPIHVIYAARYFMYMYMYGIKPLQR